MSVRCKLRQQDYRPRCPYFIHAFKMATRVSRSMFVSSFFGRSTVTSRTKISFGGPNDAIFKFISVTTNNHMKILVLRVRSTFSTSLVHSFSTELHKVSWLWKSNISNRYYISKKASVGVKYTRFGPTLFSGVLKNKVSSTKLTIITNVRNKFELPLFNCLWSCKPEFHSVPRILSS